MVLREIIETIHKSPATGEIVSVETAGDQRAAIVARVLSDLRSAEIVFRGHVFVWMVLQNFYEQLNDPDYYWGRELRSEAGYPAGPHFDFKNLADVNLPISSRQLTDYFLELAYQPDAGRAFLAADSLLSGAAEVFRTRYPNSRPWWVDGWAQLAELVGDAVDVKMTFS